MKVFVSGSRSVKKLPNECLNSLNRIMELGFEVLVGDCYGVDSLVQDYLWEKRHQKVKVFHIGKCRNNKGFKSVKIEGSRYVDKDIAMSEIADYGLAIWDGRSKGTKNNIDAVKLTKIIRV